MTNPDYFCPQCGPLRGAHPIDQAPAEKLSETENNWDAFVKDRNRGGRNAPRRKK